MDDVLLFFQEVNELNVTELAKAPISLSSLTASKSSMFPMLHVPRRAGVKGECESGREWTGVLTPADLQPTVVEGQALERSNLVEGHGGGWVNKRYEPSKSSLERS